MEAGLPFLDGATGGLEFPSASYAMLPPKGIVLVEGRHGYRPVPHGTSVPVWQPTPTRLPWLRRAAPMSEFADAMIDSRAAWLSAGLAAAPRRP
jgi:hypothetical protein